MAVCQDLCDPASGRLGVKNFLSREGSEGGEVRRTGIFVETATPTDQAPFRSDIGENRIKAKAPRWQVGIWCAVKKRWRAPAVQDAARGTKAKEQREAVLDCASPLAL